jgi:DNA mismatch endonuclease (patch repair protein)
VPKRNREFWEAKFSANRSRDARAVAALERDGWTVETVWECETTSPEALARLADRIRTRLPLPPDI